MKKTVPVRNVMNVNGNDDQPDVLDGDKLFKVLEELCSEEIDGLFERMEGTSEQTQPEDESQQLLEPFHTVASPLSFLQGQEHGAIRALSSALVQQVQHDDDDHPTGITATSQGPAEYAEMRSNDSTIIASTPSPVLKTCILHFPGCNGNWVSPHTIRISCCNSQVSADSSSAAAALSYQHVLQSFSRRSFPPMSLLQLPQSDCSLDSLWQRQAAPVDENEGTMQALVLGPRTGFVAPQDNKKKAFELRGGCDHVVDKKCKWRSQGAPRKSSITAAVLTSGTLSESSVLGSHDLRNDKTCDKDNCPSPQNATDGTTPLSTLKSFPSNDNACSMACQAGSLSAGAKQQTHRTEVITDFDIGPDDVIFGRGTKANTHPGNIRFRNLCVAI